MLKIWKLFGGATTSVISSDDVKYDGKYGATLVSKIDTARPRFVFIGGVHSLGSGDLDANQPLKINSYLKHSGINIEDVDIYIPTCSAKTPYKQLMQEKDGYNNNSAQYNSADSNQLDSALFPVTPNLESLSDIDRAKAVNTLAMLASRTTMMTFSFGSVVAEGMCNSFIERMRQNHFSSSEISTVTSSLMLFHVAPVAKLVKKEFNAPQVNMLAGNDNMVSQSNDFSTLFNMYQHPVLLDASITPDILLMGTKSLDVANSRLLLKPKKEGNFTSNLRYKDGKTIPEASQEMVFSDKKFDDPHGFDIYTATTRLIAETYSNNPQQSFAVYTYQKNPFAETLSKSIGLAVNQSINASNSNVCRNGRTIIAEIQSQLLPEKKDGVVIQYLRDQMGQLSMRKYSTQYNRFAILHHFYHDISSIL